MAEPTYGQMIEAADHPAHMTGMIIRSLKNEIDVLAARLAAQEILIDALCGYVGLKGEK